MWLSSGVVGVLPDAAITYLFIQRGETKSARSNALVDPDAPETYVVGFCARVDGMVAIGACRIRG